MVLCCLTTRAGIPPAISSCRKTSAWSSCRRTRPSSTQSSGYGRISEIIASRTASSRLPTRLSTPVVTLGIGCSAKPDEFDPCAPIPGSNRSATNQVGINRRDALWLAPCGLLPRPQSGCRNRKLGPSRDGVTDSPGGEGIPGQSPAGGHRSLGRALFRGSLHRWARAEMRHHKLAHHPVLLDHLVLRGRQRWRQVDVLHAGVALFEALQVSDEVIWRAGE